MKLGRLVRTSSFRLTLLYAGITGASFLVLFAVTFWSTAHFMREQIDSSVAAEIRELRTAAKDGHSESLLYAMTASAEGVDAFYYLLQSPEGKVLAGDFPAMEPVAGVREWRQPVAMGRIPATEIRGKGERTDDGGYLFVGTSAHGIQELQESVTRAFTWGVGAALLLVLAGGALMSATVARRIEEVSQTSRDIVDGDLTRRIPLNGSGDEFDHLAASLNGMLDRIGTLMEGLTQVSTDIAHDLRTPLTRLRQRLELAQQRQDDAPGLRQALESAITDVDAILQTFGAVLRIAQVESGTRKANFRPVSLSEVLLTVAEIYQPAIEDKQQVLDVDVAEHLWVQGDRELLTQLYVNLLENASRHCPPGARITVHGASSGSRIVTAVSDTGSGIPSELREKVLQRFYRLDVSRTTPGNGLGLSLVQAVVALHGARMELADNAPGLTVTVEHSATRG